VNQGIDISIPTLSASVEVLHLDRRASGATKATIAELAKLLVRLKRLIDQPGRGVWVFAIQREMGFFPYANFSLSPIEMMCFMSII
jgi:hypothetical protein